MVRSRVFMVSAVGALATIFAPSLIGPSQVGARVPVLSVFEQTHCPKVCKGKDRRGKYVIRTILYITDDTDISAPGSRVVAGQGHGEIYSYKLRKVGPVLERTTIKTVRDEEFPRCTPKGNAVTVTYLANEADPSDDQVVGTTTTDSNGNWEVIVSSDLPRNAQLIAVIAGHTVKYRGEKVKCRAGGGKTSPIVGI